MDTGLLIFRQLMMMFLYLAVGFVFYRRRIITDEGSREMASLLVRLVIPAVIIKSFCRERSAESARLRGYCCFFFQ